MLSLKGGTRPPWVGLGASVWLTIAAGNGNNFPLYSHTLKSVMGLNQQQLTMFGVANDIGENIGLLPGLVCNKFPPWVVLLIGVFSCFIGYGTLWLSVSGIVPNLPYWLIWIAIVVATNSSAWFNTSLIVTNMRNFPLNRGMVSGILMGYGGLSAAVFTEVYSVLLHNSSNLLLFLAVGVPAICIIMVFFVRPCTPASGDDPSENHHFLFIQAASAILGVYVLTATILEDIFVLSVPVSYVILIIMIRVLKRQQRRISYRLAWEALILGRESLRLICFLRRVEGQLRKRGGLEEVKILSSQKLWSRPISGVCFLSVLLGLVLGLRS
ncbi:unnamed protein product [Cuscuta europaea]|uniref:Nodulin-like domain-containing protein n=1 Tax=Cuscuta europaea TaxID=41803 RepID=A0A9P0Z4E4_CUSEU|nr:unnamed protein product [Cuscuta europaea]